MSLQQINYTQIRGASPNVLDFGADPTGVVDSSSIFQTALNSCKNGQILYIPAGNYLLNNQITIPSSCGGIVGENIGVTNITFTKQQPSGSPVYDGSACAIVISGVNNAIFSDFTLIYTGTYYVPGNPYIGVVSGLFIQNCNDVIVSRVEATGFNNSGVQFISTAPTLSLRNVIEECYLHHNMIAGCAADHQKTFTIRNCKLEYNGDPAEGGTGYGFTANTGGYNQDLLVTENQTYNNYRKGIDFHDGFGVVCTDNMCIKDRLHGIFFESTSTPAGDILIANNYIECDPTDYLASPYNFYKGISVNIAPNATSMLPSITISGNILNNIYKNNSTDTLPIYVEDQSGSRTLVNITKNTVRGGNADFGIFVESNTNANEMTANIEGNIISLGSLNSYGIAVTPYDPSATGTAGYCQIINNNIIATACGGPLFSIKTGMKDADVSDNEAFITTLSNESVKIENTVNAVARIKNNSINFTSDSSTNKIVYGNQLIAYTEKNVVGGIEQPNVAIISSNKGADVYWRGSKSLTASTLTDITYFCQQNTQGYYKVKWSAYYNTNTPTTATAGGEFIFTAAWSDNGQICSSAITTVSSLNANNGATDISLTWGIASGIVGSFARKLQVTSNVNCSLYFEVESTMSLNSTTVTLLPNL